MSDADELPTPDELDYLQGKLCGDRGASLDLQKAAGSIISRLRQKLQSLRAENAAMADLLNIASELLHGHGCDFTAYECWKLFRKDAP